MHFAPAIQADRDEAENLGLYMPLHIMLARPAPLIRRYTFSPNQMFRKVRAAYSQITTAI